jgi:alpha-galactosidase
VDGCGEWIANCANLWRTGSDLEATWDSIMKNADQTAPLYSLAGIQGEGSGKAGHWNDPDMLQVGNVGISVTESKAHFALWCWLAAPLLIGTDLHTASNDTIAILGAKELIAIDQDALGFQGRVVKDASSDGTNATRYQIYGKKLADGSVGALLLNRGDVALDITLSFQDVWFTDTSGIVRDLNAEEDLGSFLASYTAKAIPSHGHVALRIRKAQQK